MSAHPEPPKQDREWWRAFRQHVLLMPEGWSWREERAKSKAAKEAKRAAKRGQPAPVEQAADAANPWVTNQPPAQEPTPAAPPAPAPRAPAAAGSWAVENEQTFWGALSKALRVLLVVALVMVSLIGLRQMIWPARSTTTVQQVQAETFPEAAGGDVARRYVAAYLTMSPGEDAAAARRAAMVLDDPTIGHDNSVTVSGKQTVSNLAVVRVAQLDKSHARAMVTGAITYYSPKGKEWTAGKPQPFAVEVLLGADKTGAVTAQGVPAFVSTKPGPVAIPARSGDRDATVASETQQAAQSFFVSYGRDETVTASVAPGVTIGGLNAGAKFKALTDWSVQEGTGDSRAATARVTWTLPNGIDLTQSYALTLSSVSADQTGGWQISAISGSTPKQ